MRDWDGPPAPSSEALRLLYESLTEGACFVPAGGGPVQGNPACLRILGLREPEELVRGLLHGEALTDPQRTEALIQARESRAEVRGFQAEARTPDGRRIALEMDLIPSFAPDRSFLGHLVLVRDITREQRLESGFLHQAYYDPLTGLPNRNKLHDRLWACLRRAKAEPGFSFAVFYLDVDRFSSVIMSLGHLCGDQLLMDLAQRLREGLAGRASVFHMAGDHFAVLAEGVAPGQAEDLSRAIMACFTPPFSVAEQTLYLSCCLGLAFSEPGSAWPEHFLRNAALAMHQAKGRGAGHREVFTSGMHERSQDFLKLGTEFRLGLERREFFPLFQPIVDLETGRVEGFEALVRWRRPGAGLVPPQAFIPYAEDFGLIVPLGRQVWEMACQGAARLRDRAGADRRVSVSVNVSGKELLQPGLARHVSECLERFGLPASCLKAEITETVLFRDAAGAMERLAELRDLGLALVLDDFGVGYSSMASLKDYPFSTLKLDRSFIRDIQSREKDRHVVRALLSLAAGLSMGVVAEGIETEAQLKTLLDLGCELGQGYLYSRPVDLDQACDLLD